MLGHAPAAVAPDVDADPFATTRTTVGPLDEAYERPTGADDGSSSAQTER
jgi:hypothetical protein